MVKCKINEIEMKWKTRFNGDGFRNRVTGYTGDMNQIEVIFPPNRLSALPTRPADPTRPDATRPDLGFHAHGAAATKKKRQEATTTPTPTHREEEQQQRINKQNGGPRVYPFFFNFHSTQYLNVC